MATVCVDRKVTMARRAERIQVSDVLEHLGSSDDEWVAEGSDDDLEMEPSYSYDSDSSEEGIVLQ